VLRQISLPLLRKESLPEKMQKNRTQAMYVRLSNGVISPTFSPSVMSSGTRLCQALLKGFTGNLNKKTNNSN
jgi:hypothetical protein